MDNVALITGSSQNKSDSIAKILSRDADNIRIVGFSNIDAFGEAHLRNEFYDKIVLINKALDGDVEKQFNQLHELMSIKAPNSKIESVDLVYVVFSDTLVSNINLFNKLFTEQNTAILRSKVASTGHIPVNLFVSACEMAPSDVIKANPNDNHKVVGTSQPTSADSLSIGYEMGDHSETGWLDNSLPPEDDSDLKEEQLPEDNEDIPQMGVDDSSDALADDSQQDDNVTTNIPPVPLTEDELNEIKSTIDSIPSTNIKVDSYKGVFLVSSLNKKDVQYPVIKFALQSVLQGNKVLIVDLTREHNVLSVFRDEENFNSYEKGINREPYITQGLSCIALSDNANKAEFTLGIRQTYSGYTSIFFVMDLEDLKLFNYGKYHGICICISLLSNEDNALIMYFSGTKIASNQFAKAFGENGHLSYMDGKIPEHVKYFIDRVDWFKE